MNDKNKYNRYHRQLILQGFGDTAQDALCNARVLVVGAGGLGCPALQYLTAAGVGTMGIIDFDVVELSNLQRQTIFTMEDIAKPKVNVVAAKLLLLNPETVYHTYPERLTVQNALDIMEQYDMVIDGSDNFSTRYLVNDACVLLNKPLIYGAVLRYEGQVGVFNFNQNETEKTNYRDLFPTPPLPGTIPSCTEAGVLGVLPGIIGTMQAAEAIKIITGIGLPLSNKILSYQLLNNTFFECEVTKAKDKKIACPATKEAFQQFNYEWFCGADQLREISVIDFSAFLEKEELQIIDVREIGEMPRIHEFSFLQIPLSRFKESLHDFQPNGKIVLICLSGVRSQKALAIFKEYFPDTESYSLHGGIRAWKEYHAFIDLS